MPLPLIYLGCGLISGFLFAANETKITSNYKSKRA